MKYKKIFLISGVAGALLSINGVTNCAIGGVAREPKCPANCHPETVNGHRTCVSNNGGHECIWPRNLPPVRAATTGAVKTGVVKNTTATTEIVQSQNRLASGGIRIVQCAQNCALATTEDGFLVQPYNCVNEQNIDCGAATIVSGNVTPTVQNQNYATFILSELVVAQVPDAF